MRVPTGELLERAAGRVEVLARSSAAGTGYADWLRALQRYCTKLFAAGITHVCDPGVDGMLEGYLRRAQESGDLPLSVSMLFVSRSGLFEPPTDRLPGPVTGERMDKLDVGALKLFADGGSRCAICVGLLESVGGVLALAGRAARLRRPALLLRSRAPDRAILTEGGRLRLGFLHYSEDELRRLCQQAVDRGFQLAVHAACNAGIENAIRAYEHLGTGKYRHRVEHLVSLDRKQAARLAATGAIGVVQPSYLTLLGDDWEAMPAPTRLHSLPLRDLLEAGVPLAGSSDAPVADYSPILGMQAAVTRGTAGGLVHQAEQAISPLQALALWTTGAALAANLSEEAGRLVPGSRGNLVVLSKNPLEVRPEAWPEIRVERTIIGGKTVYLNAEAKPNAHR
jgi:predicted amidohydrolase YtcJ